MPNPNLDLFHAERARALRELAKARRKHARTQPHLDRAVRATAAALRWEMERANG